MNRVSQFAVLVATCGISLLFARKSVTEGLEIAKAGWEDNPHRMVSQVAASTICGQGAFWWIGSDQIGIGMNPVWQVGAGKHVAESVYGRIPHSPAVAWSLKLVEIALDYAKCYTEAAPYRRHGVTPDGVACLVTQPVWSAIEGGEKVAGAVNHPERVTTPEGMKLSILCIYGSLVRFILDGLFYLGGRHINRYVARPIEHGLRKAH